MLRHLSLVAVAVVAVATPALAANPLAALPIGKAVTYHITTDSVKPAAQGGETTSSTYLSITRATPATFNVTVNGAPAGQLTANPDGTMDVPDQLKKPLAPFGEMGLLMKGAPQPLAPNSSWAATVPIPLGDTTDNVTANVAVTEFGESGATMIATGQNATDVRPLVREKQANVTYSAMMHYNTMRVLTSARSSASVAVKAGMLRKKNFTSTWTMTLVP
jgi:hypothetical protein